MSSLGGGKRFRPFLVVESAALFDVPRQNALMAGAALECVHCYSLAHDDLPAMDNDALRRGQPTAHKKFDEATAILAGDGLLTFAFDILSRPQTHADPAVRIELVNVLARAAGVGGMAGGQMLDLAAEGRFGDGRATDARRERRADVAGDENRRAVALCLPGRRHSGGGDPAAAPHSNATARRSARHSRSPTICSISKAIRRWSANRPARMRRPARPPWSACSARRAPRRGSSNWSPRPKQALAPFGPAAATLIEGAHFVAERACR